MTWLKNPQNARLVPALSAKLDKSPFKSHNKSQVGTLGILDSLAFRLYETKLSA